MKGAMTVRKKLIMLFIIIVILMVAITGCLNLDAIGHGYQDGWNSYPGNKPQGGEENAQQAKPNLRLCSARRGGINYHVSGPA